MGGGELENIGELLNCILELSIYCVKFWNSMEKSWHHFDPKTGGLQANLHRCLPALEFFPVNFSVVKSLTKLRQSYASNLTKNRDPTSFTHISFKNAKNAGSLKHQTHTTSNL